MHKQGLFRWVLVAVFALTSIGISGIALAQDDGETGIPEDAVLIEIEGEVNGLVQTLDGDMILVENTLVDPAGAFDPSTLVLGDYVVIEGYLLEDDTILAISLEVVDPDEVEDPGEDDEMEDPDEDEETEDDDLCMRDDHPVVLAMEETYGESLGVTYEELITLHCEGNGLGNIVKVLEAAERSGAGDLDELLEGEEGELVEGLTFDEMWELYEEAGNLGQFKKVLADEYGIHPSDLAPGQAVGKGKPDKDADDDPDDDANPGPPGGDGPPGQTKDKAPGKSSAPGQQKDKTRGPK